MLRNREGPSVIWIDDRRTEEAIALANKAASYADGVAIESSYFSTVVESYRGGRIIDPGIIEGSDELNRKPPVERQTWLRRKKKD